MSLQICAPVSVIRNEKPNNSNNTCPYKTAKVRHLPQQIQSLSAQPPLPNVKHALVEKTVVYISGSGVWDSAFETIVGGFKPVYDAMAKQGLQASGLPMIIYTATD